MLTQDYFTEKQIENRYLLLLSLVDSAKPTVELFKAESPSQKEWRKTWLKQAQKLLDEHKLLLKKERLHKKKMEKYWADLEKNKEKREREHFKKWGISLADMDDDDEK
jgi:hypothetical protein